MNVLHISLLGCLVVAPSASAQKVKWCVKTQNELKKCEHLASKSADLECQLRPSIFECIKSVKDGEADVLTADGKDVYLGGLHPYRLRPIIAEKYKKGCCYAVAVVKSDTNFNINELRGKTSCHSCYQSSGGWNIPIGRLIAENKITWDGLDDMPLEKAVSQFFSSSCIPGISKAQYPHLCRSCQGDCSCSQSEMYSGDEGALQCLKNGKGQVAFVCHDAIPVSERPNYQLLCMDGSRKNVEEYKNCHLAKELARAVLGRKYSDSDSVSQQIYKVLKQIPDSDLFSSVAFGGKDLIFSDSASGLIELPKFTDSFFYLKEDYFKSMLALRDGNPHGNPLDPKIEWCTVGFAEHFKCDKLSSNVTHLACTRESSVKDCIKKIKRGEADFFAADSGLVYIAGKCGLVPAMVEQYDQQSCNDGEAIPVNSRKITRMTLPVNTQICYSDHLHISTKIRVNSVMSVIMKGSLKVTVEMT